MTTKTTIIDAMNAAVDSGCFKPTEYSIGKYEGKWGIFSATSRCWILTDMSKRDASKRCNELNSGK